ncbi:MAG TPA: RNA polymerase sigma factor [Ornithinicoccus sp.]|nr:RNA polymerase sigma factor [Ornithinicoccus sp.]
MTAVVTRPAWVIGGHVRPSADPVERAVHEVFVAHYGRLAGWAGHLIGDRELGHDVATEAFTRLLSHWQTVDDPRPWLYATAGNLVRDHWRKRGREGSAYERYQGGRDDPETAAPGPDLAQGVSVRTAVEGLPDRLRLPVLLFYFGDLSVAEVARQLGRSEGAVKRDLYDARARLATTLGEAR